ncbi:MAG: hypothetical protein LBH05_05300 [Deferribacteraceae bacterium]|jgi:hypothetical protein|nr:hypothetical protein [Deferribacteraceae bacterium]
MNGNYRGSCAAADGDTAIYVVPHDLMGEMFLPTSDVLDKIKMSDNIIGYSYYDDTFINANEKNEIYLNRDMADDYNDRVQTAAFQNSVIALAFYSQTNGKYDVKNLWPAIVDPGLADVKASGEGNNYLHQNGYLLGGKYITGQMAGNMMFGENLQNNTNIFNSVGIFGAGVYHQKTNSGGWVNWMKNFSISNFSSSFKEDPDALKYINLGIGNASENFRKMINKMNNE